MEKKESGNLKVIGGEIPQRIVPVITVKGEYLAPALKGTSRVEGYSLVTWSSSAVKLASETVEEVISVSEGEASVSENSCYSTGSYWQNCKQN